MSQRRRRRDHFTRRAKQQSYPARSVFKLQEMDRKYRLLRPGGRVLDLGCAPGSWLMYASEQIGASGLVVGVDRHSVKVSLPDNASYLELDALALEPEHLTELGISRFDVVLSDMAPHTSGDRFVDQQRSLRLFLRALALARSYTRRGGSFVGKIFQGEDLDEARAEAEASFERVRLYRPAATRKRSYEIYLICQGRLAPAPA